MGRQEGKGGAVVGEGVGAYFIFVTTITTAGCVKKSVRCKIFEGYVKETDLILHKMCSFQKVCSFTYSV